jgi:hypothetical protein
MKIKNLLERLVFGERVNGEPIGEPKTKTTIPGLIPRPTEKEWKKEFNVSSRYTRFDAQGNFYDYAGDEQQGNVLKIILTGSI